MSRTPVQRKLTSAPGRPMPPVPSRTVKIVARHAYDCGCRSCERDRNLLRKRYDRERTVAAFGEGRC